MREPSMPELQRSSRRSASARIRRIGAPAAFAASALLLAACGGGDSSSTSTNTTGPSPPSAPPPAVITVSGAQILKDGVPWIPHAVHMVAFVAPPKAQTGAFIGAYAHYSTAELDAVKAWGADSIRFQLGQPGADPQNALYDPSFVQTFVSAVKYARSIGLNVIVSIQDESQSGETTPAMLPDDATNRVWRNIAPMLNGDNGIVYELFNEPELTETAANWQLWATAMNGVIQTIRATGATNAILADGIAYAQTLNGVIPLTDPVNKVIYAVHPYFHTADDETQAAWVRKFGNAAQTLPVIVGEWTTITSYYCDSTTPTAALNFLQYLQSIHVGLAAVGYDFGLPTFGGIVSDYNGTPTTFANNIQCGTAGFGPGTLIQNWYRTGSVATTLQ